MKKLNYLFVIVFTICALFFGYYAVIWFATYNGIVCMTIAGCAAMADVLAVDRIINK